MDLPHLASSLRTKLAQDLDRLVLAGMNHRLPDTFEPSHADAPSFEDVLAQTRVCQPPSTPAGIARPGEYQILLETAAGTLPCHVHLHPAGRPDAPLLLYHHGLHEVPYTFSCARIFRPVAPFPAHVACVQAPFHNHWSDPIAQGFASLRNVYQMFAGSVRVLELMQDHFESRGAPYTVVAGVSWGGITSVLYQALTGRARAVVPMLSSPNLAQVILDVAALFDRPIRIPEETVADLLDFSDYYARCDPGRVFPLLARHDLFFRWEHHAPVVAAYAASRPVPTIPQAHITGFLDAPRLRRHILGVLAHCERSPSDTNCETR